MKIKYIISFILLLFITAMFIGCDDFLTQEPKTMINDDNYFNNENEIESFTNGLHALFRDNFGGVTYIYRDRGMPFDYMSATWSNPSNNKPTWPTDYITLQWLNIYKIITDAYILLENLDKAHLSEDRYNFYAGQAYCILAYCYYDLIRYWGDAPLVKSSKDYGPMKRTAGRVLADYAAKLYDKAILYLPVASQLKDSQGQAIITKQVPSKGSAQMGKAHLLALVAGIYNEPELYHEADTLISAIINSHEYELANNMKEVCEVVMLGNSKEGIWEIDFQNKYNETISLGSCIAGLCQTWPAGKPYSTPNTKRRLLRINNNTVYALYPDSTDERRQEYFYKLDSMAGVSAGITQGAAYINKWRGVIKYTDGPKTGQIKIYDNNVIIYRYSDVLLLGAEAKVSIGDEAGAIELLNQVRRRAKAKDYTPSEGDLKYAIFHERERELFLENGHRFFDAIRCHFVKEALQPGFQNLTETDIRNGAYYLPISINEIQKNTLARQTIYWQNQY